MMGQAYSRHSHSKYEKQERKKWWWTTSKSKTAQGTCHRIFMLKNNPLWFDVPPFRLNGAAALPSGPSTEGAALRSRLLLAGTVLPGGLAKGPCLAYCNQPDGFPFETEEGALVISKLPLASFFPCLKDTVNVHNQRVLWFGPIGSKLTGFLTFILISLPFLVQTGSVFADHLFSIPAYCGNDWFKWCFTLMLISL